ncbi:MAG: ring-cleaving dioxygenase [Armatimonadota bacterium]|nr:ring-cleaving dioxygenase [Armatimonadota bacterium]MDR5697171.1 ring-cleaving dioxygenase [Armatimonadota bacterium]
MRSVFGLHHVTAISGPAQENLDFYAGVLGMRLVKRSVNQDDPGTYHLFYADGEGRPGTDLTFFPWDHLPRGRKGVGLSVEVSLAVPSGTLGYWRERLLRYGVVVGEPQTRFGERTLPFVDPQGLDVALVEVEDRAFSPWEEGPVSADKQVRGLHAARTWEGDLPTTARFLTEVLGFEFLGEEGGWHRFGVDGGGSGRILDVREVPNAGRGRWGVGTIHHLAWRVADDDHQAEVRRRVAEAGMRPTPVVDRFWFRSVYFTEPGGVLFELATDGPGFAVDEDPAHLGESLVLPPWLEGQRAGIEAALPPLRYPPAPEPAPAP